MIKTTFIYALRRPDTKDIFYIGKSYNPKLRLSQHLNEARRGGRNKAKLKEMVGLGVFPELIILEETNEENWQEAEKKWIAFYRRDNDALLNKTVGGGGIKFPGLEESGKIVYELNEAATALGIGIATLYRRMKDKTIIPIRLSGRTFIPKSEIERLTKKAED